jgi:hypothetical protein
VNWNPNRYPLAPASHRDQIRRVSEDQVGELEERRSAATQAPSQTVADSILAHTVASAIDRPGGSANSPLELGGQSSQTSRRAIWANWNPNAPMLASQKRLVADKLAIKSTVAADDMSVPDASR